MEEELVNLLEAAKKASDDVTMYGVSSSRPEESRCLDALKQLKNLSISYDALASTQAAKQLRPLTKIRSKKIKTLASALLESWKQVVIEEESARNKRKDDDTTSFKTNDALRDKVREVLAEALSKVSMEVGRDIRFQVLACDPTRIAVDIESVMFEKMGPFNGSKKLKYRSIMFNINDPNNPDLRRKVLLGEVKPERLVNMSPEEMASDKRQCEMNQRKEKKALAEKAAEEIELRLNSNKKEPCFD